MAGSSNEGVKTILVPVSDIEKAKAVYTALLGGPPQHDASYYVGFRHRGPAHRARARWWASGHDDTCALLACL
jgi:hypothetical protein